jgi:hypothetical protein
VVDRAIQGCYNLIYREINMGIASISLSGAAIAQSQKINITIEIEATVSISAVDAQRSVNGWLLDNVSHLAMADEPRLLLGSRTAWRVPVLLSSLRRAPQGPIGYIEVDAESGQLFVTSDTAETLIANGRTVSSLRSSHRQLTPVASPPVRKWCWPFTVSTSRKRIWQMLWVLIQNSVHQRLA